MQSERFNHAQFHMCFCLRLSPNNIHDSVFLHESLTEECSARRLKPPRTLGDIGSRSRDVDAVVLVRSLVGGRGATALNHKQELDHHRLINSKEGRGINSLENKLIWNF